jgi:hypothetical protein
MIFDLFFHQRRHARAFMLTNATLGILLERFVGFGGRLRLLNSVPTCRFLSLFAFETVRAAPVSLRWH